MKEETNQKGKIEGKTDSERNEIKRKGEGGKENYQGKQIVCLIMLTCDAPHHALAELRMDERG